MPIDIKVPAFILSGYFLIELILNECPIEFGIFRFFLPQIYFILAIALVFRLTPIRWVNLGFMKEHLGQNLALGLIAGLVPNLVIALAWVGERILGGWGGGVDLLTWQMGLPPLLPMFSLLLLAPVTEEIIFRGFLFASLRQSFSPAGSILLSAVIFMAAHLSIHPGAFILGLFAALLFHLTGSLIPSIILHSLSNLSGLVLTQIFPSVFHWFHGFYGN
jgi:membrane protease YdiL (CAAX protease family)